MDEQIYKFLWEQIGNPVGVCALMGNLYVESHLDPKLLESSKARRMGTTSEQYASDVDSGKITRKQFAHDGAGYGLAQWTYWSRKQGLYDYAKETNRSISDLSMQLEYLWKELQTYKTVIKAMISATNLREVSDIIAIRYEKPEHIEEKYLQNRANHGQKYYDRFAIKMEEKGAEKLMNSANFVDEQIQVIKNSGVPYSEQAWQFALLCMYWAYVFGAYGEYCDPSNRRSRYRDDHPTIKSKCQNFKGSDDNPAGCVGCKWFTGDASSDQSKHEGRTRVFDCRGFVYYVLHKMFGMWKSCPAGATTMWNTDSNWAQKGLVKDGVPNDTLVCLFYKDSQQPSKMAHIGFGYKGQTVECSNGVEYHEKYHKKWTHWAVPKCVVGETQSKKDEDAPPSKDDITGFPTLRQGAKGDIVKTMQQMLAAAGSSLTIDGIFGSGTRTAVIAFQKKNELDADGIVGPKTWAKLVEVNSIILNDSFYVVTLNHVPAKDADELIKKYGGRATAE